MENIFWTKEFLDKNLIICSKSLETHFGFIIIEIWRIEQKKLDKKVMYSESSEAHFGLIFLKFDKKIGEKLFWDLNWCSVKSGTISFSWGGGGDQISRSASWGGANKKFTS